MGILRDPLWLAQPRIAKNTTRRPRLPTASATANGRLPPPQMIASGPSSAVFAGRRLGHASSSVEARRIAMVSGREPARMKAITLPTSGSAPFCAAT